jgi:DNA-binding transcriptional MerR regulator
MRIGVLARRTGVNQRLLRYYEEQNLLRPTRRPSGYREYAESDVMQVQHIRALLAAGLNTTVIAEILPCVRDDEDRLVPTCPDMIAHLHRERAHIARTISQLQISKGLLDALLDAVPSVA